MTTGKLGELIENGGKGRSRVKPDGRVRARGATLITKEKGPTERLRCVLNMRAGLGVLNEVGGDRSSKNNAESKSGGAERGHY